MSSMRRTSGAHSPNRFESQPGCGMAADEVVYEAVGQYLNRMLPELNLRLLCDAEAEAGGFPQKILWVEEVTMLTGEEKSPAYGCEEKDCLEERRSVKGKGYAFSSQIKYIVDKIKGHFKSSWKKKGRK